MFDEQTRLGGMHGRELHDVMLLLVKRKRGRDAVTCCLARLTCALMIGQQTRPTSAARPSASETAPDDFALLIARW